MSVVKKIVLVLIASILLGCKNLKVVAYKKPMTNDELARYIRLIEHRRLISMQMYYYDYTNRRNFYYTYPNFNSNNNNYRNYKKQIAPQTGTVGNTTSNVITPVPKGNIKTNQ